MLGDQVVGTEDVIRAAAASKRKPVLIVASSREVYGETIALPMHEDTPVAPVNFYGRSRSPANEPPWLGATLASIRR